MYDKYEFKTKAKKCFYIHTQEKSFFFFFK